MTQKRKHGSRKGKGKYQRYKFTDKSSKTKTKLKKIVKGFKNPSIYTIEIDNKTGEMRIKLK